MNNIRDNTIFWDHLNFILPQMLFLLVYRKYNWIKSKTHHSLMHSLMCYSLLGNCYGIRGINHMHAGSISAAIGATSHRHCPIKAWPILIYSLLHHPCQLPQAFQYLWSVKREYFQLILHPVFAAMQILTQMIAVVRWAWAL